MVSVLVKDMEFLAVCVLICVIVGEVKLLGLSVTEIVGVFELDAEDVFELEVEKLPDFDSLKVGLFVFVSLIVFVEVWVKSAVFVGLVDSSSVLVFDVILELDRVISFE
jgi:hypothetical protein